MKKQSFHNMTDEQIKKLNQVINFIYDSDEVLERPVVKLGNGAHVSIPRKHAGKIAKIFIQKKKELEDKE
jgi:putative transposon-encoded protein